MDWRKILQCLQVKGTKIYNGQGTHTNQYEIK